jgi:hypothetical protein
MAAMSDPKTPPPNPPKEVCEYCRGSGVKQNGEPCPVCQDKDQELRVPE